MSNIKKKLKAFIFSQTKAPSVCVPTEERNALPKKVSSAAKTKKRHQAFNRTKVVGKRFAKNRARRPFFAISAAVPLGGRGAIVRKAKGWAKDRP